MPKFSILTSAHLWNNLRVKQLQRCGQSILFQKDWEWILVDDGSPMPVNDHLNILEEKRIKTFRVPHLERVVALNRAFQEAKGEWITFLDADDEYFSYSLQAMSQMIEKNPDSRLFNFASLHVRRNYGTAIRGPFEPKKKKVGHEVFGGGNIVNGTFFFHRSVYEKLGGFPTVEKMWNPWDFSMEAQREFPEIKPLFTVKHPDHPEGLARELGNPWGNDYYLFYKYTRQYHSKTYNIPLIIIHHEGKKEGETHGISD